jgi:hypothetical protein
VRSAMCLSTGVAQIRLARARWVHSACWLGGCAAAAPPALQVSEALLPASEGMQDLAIFHAESTGYGEQHRHGEPNQCQQYLRAQFSSTGCICQEVYMC